MKFDHVAINCNNIRETVNWYLKNTPAKIVYEDDTWALLDLLELRLALVVPNQHPPHIAIRLDTIEELKNMHSEKSRAGLCSALKEHRDKTVSFYQYSPNNTAVEWIVYPKDDIY